MNSNETPLVSVCIQTYQHRSFIRECLDSVLQQKTDFPFEIIIGEDESTDGTRDICIQYAQQYPGKIRLFLREEKDKVYVDGVKTGRFNFLNNLRKARGKYISLLDGDDYMLDDRKLQKQVNFLETHPELSCCGHKVYCKVGKKIVAHPDNHFWPTKDSIMDIDYLFNDGFIPMSSSMFLRKHVEDIPGWFWEVPIIDYPLHVHLAQKGKLGFLIEPMSVYRIHRQSRWNSQKAPACNIILWKLYSIMYSRVNGSIAVEMKRLRKNEGIQLAQFYKMNMWKDASWFENNLKKKEFGEDDEYLLTELRSPRGLRAYLVSIYTFTRYIMSLVRDRVRAVNLFNS